MFSSHKKKKKFHNCLRKIDYKKSIPWAEKVIRLQDKGFGVIKMS